jgi:uncharacterized membrane protein
MDSLNAERFWEIDSLRGIAIIMMVIFHIIFDLAFFEVYDLDFKTGALFYFNISIPLLFLMLVGISLTLKNNKFRLIVKETPGRIIRSIVQRGFVILIGGILISFSTWFLLSDGIIHFGILHLIGISVIMAIPLLQFRWLNLVLGSSCIILGIIIESIRIDGYYLIWLGFRPSIYYSLDYFPILPWFGIVLFGIFLGNHFYDDYQRSFALKDISQNFLIKKINFLGKHSLIIYFLHQPIIIVTMIIAGIIDYSIIFSAF